VVAAALALPVLDKRDQAIALRQQADQARTQAASADTLRQQLETVVENYNFTLSRKYAYPSVLQVLDDVTRLLPDDTWLTSLELKTLAKAKELPRKEILLRGESGNAGRLVSLLEDSHLFEQAAPRSPTTKIQPGPGEIFDLGAQLKPTPMPEPVAIGVAKGDVAAGAGGGRSGAVSGTNPSTAAAASNPANAAAATNAPASANAPATANVPPGAGVPPGAPASANAPPAGGVPARAAGTPPNKAAAVAAPPAGTPPANGAATAPTPSAATRTAASGRFVIVPGVGGDGEPEQ